MKFAKSLLRNEVPEWSPWYIDYKTLKKLVNQVSKELNDAHTSSSNSPSTDGINKLVDDRETAPFFYAIDRNVETVDNFYNSKFTEYTRRLRHIEQQRTLLWHQVSHHESEDLDKVEITAMLLELRSNLRNLQWYADVNKQGFTKILKKFDKKVGTRAKTQYMTSKINILGFCNGQELIEKIGTVSALLKEIAPDIQANLETPQLPGGRVLLDASYDPQSLSPMEKLKVAIDKDDHQTVREMLATGEFNAKQIGTFVLRALAVHANATIQVLIEYSSPVDLLSMDAINRRNILHRALISEGRNFLESRERKLKIDAGIPSRTSLSGGGAGSGESNGSSELVESQHHSYENIIHSLEVFLNALSKRVPLAGLALCVDHNLRTPVHYASRYGLADTVKYILDLEPASLSFSDSDGLTPLDLAVIHRHPRTLQEILAFNPTPKPQLLLTAAKLNASQVCKALVENGNYDVNIRDSNRGESALHISAKHNHLDTVRMLLSLGADLEIRESLFGWTPIFLAAVDGLVEIAEELLAAGAKADTLDNSGWSAKEHAALRGHLDLAAKLPSPASSLAAPGGPPQSLDKRKPGDDEALKTFGHRYLDDPEENLVLVTLGSRDMRFKSVSPVQLDTVPMSEAANTQLDTALSLIVRAQSSSSEPHYVDLPVPELGLATEPFPFFTKDLSKFQLVFDLVPTYSNGDRPIARGVYAPPRVPKIQDLNLTMQSVLIVEATTLRILGQVNFELLVVTPFIHPNNGINVNTTYWRSLITTRVIGHRGLGKNTLANSSLQLGENTVESFIQAANLGAGYVEFDVQLTKDAVPVIYHDFLVGDSGFDIPMHAMTLDQFMNIQRPTRGRSDSLVPRPWDEKWGDSVPVPPISASSNGHGSPSSPPSSGQPESGAQQHAGKPGGHADPFDSRDYMLKKRSSSVHQFNRNHDLDSNYDDAYRRMRFTRDFKNKGFKGNVRGLHIQSKFATLEELFKSLPDGLGFNIEFKYPMLDEAQAEEMDGTVIEINKFVDTILQVIFDNKKERDIILSSFNPDVCILLSLKQPSIPVLYLTEGGTTPMMDVRASSLQEAVRFSKRFNLLGIVSEALPLIMCPRLVRAVKESGLVCFTYGTENNVPENARIQLKAGIDAVIVDSVLAIRKELTEHDKDDILVQELTNTLEKANINQQQ